MDRLEKAKVHKAIDDVLTDHYPGMRATRVMIRELILDAIDGAGFTFVGVPAYGETVVAEAEVRHEKPYPLDYGKPVTFNERNGDGPQDNLCDDGWVK